MCSTNPLSTKRSSLTLWHVPLLIPGQTGALLLAFLALGGAESAIFTSLLPTYIQLLEAIALITPPPPPPPSPKKSFFLLLKIVKCN